jgi:hypothetical protein
MRRIVRRIRNTRAILRVLDRTDTGQFAARRLGEVGIEIEEAQRLHAHVYIQRNFISPEDIDDSGRMHLDADPHQTHSYYFGVYTKSKNDKPRLVATARQIQYNPSKGWDSFPILAQAQVYPSWKERILKMDPSKAVEISGLAKHRPITSVAPLMLYKAMWHRSLEDGHKLWLMAVDVKLYDRLKVLFGDAIKKVGRTTTYQGGDIVPAVFYPHKCIRELVNSTLKSRFLHRRIKLKVIAFLLYDLSEIYLSKTDKRSLSDGGITLGGRSAADSK